MRAWTDYPFFSEKPAPIREVHVLGWDRDKYCLIKVEDRMKLVKRAYLYTAPARLEAGKRVPTWRLAFLPRINYEELI